MDPRTRRRARAERGCACVWKFFATLGVPKKNSLPHCFPPHPPLFTLFVTHGSGCGLLRNHFGSSLLPPRQLHCWHSHGALFCSAQLSLCTPRGARRCLRRPLRILQQEVLRAGDVATQGDHQSWLAGGNVPTAAVARVHHDCPVQVSALLRDLTQTALLRALPCQTAAHIGRKEGRKGGLVLAACRSHPTPPPLIPPHPPAPITRPFRPTQRKRLRQRSPCDKGHTSIIATIRLHRAQAAPPNRGK